MITDVSFPIMSEEDPAADGHRFTVVDEPGADDPLGLGVQVDKVSQDVEAPVAGTMYQYVAEGVAIQQGAPLARIDS